MHIIGIIIAIATAIYWVGRAARGAKDIADVASTFRNMPRRSRFKNRASQRGMELIDDPMDAATILMVSVARLSAYSQAHDGLLSDKAQARILSVLVKSMQLSRREAEELLTQMRWTTKNFVQADTALVPMTNILSASINHSDAEDLSNMLRKISHADTAATTEQKDFINRFRNRIGLNV